PGTTPQIPGGPLGGGWSGDNAALQDQLRAYAGAQAAGQLPGLGQPGGGGMMGGGAGGWGSAYGFSPQMQQVLQARRGMGPGGLGGGETRGGAGDGGRADGPGRHRRREGGRA